MEPKICPCCGEVFQPRPQVQNQTYCSSPACQRERRQAWQRKKLQDNRFYRENRQDAQRAWRERNLTTLAPDIVAAILDDALPNHVTLFDLAVDPPALWDEQRVRLAQT